MRRPTCQSSALVLALVFSTLALRADVTVRYKIDYKFNASLPSAVTGPALRQMDSALPTETVMQLKGDKGYSTFGKMTYLMDFAKQEVTLVDAAMRRFATVPMKDFADKLGVSVSAMTPEVQRSMASIKTSFSSRKTGRTDTIQGVAAEESEWIISMDMAQPVGTQPAGPFMKMAIQIWSAKPEEALRLQALREWAGYAAYSNYLMNPLTALQKIFATMPGAVEGHTSMMEEGSKSLMLKSHAAVYMPMMSQLTPGFDPSAAFMDIGGEIVELSAAAVDESVFHLPDGYEAASVEDLMKSVIAPPGATPPSVPPPAPAASGQASQRIRVRAASLIQKVEPVYPPLAQQNGIEGTVRFSIIIDKEGHVSNAQLVTGHPALVEAARNAVMQWMYKPTLLNGQPIEVVLQVDVSFKLQ
jgi:TonB family protein